MVNNNGSFNTPDLVTREYIHRQLSRNTMVRQLEYEFNLFAYNNPNMLEYKLAEEFLNSKELPVVSFFTHKTIDIYKDHFLFFFTHAAYYEYTQLVKRTQERLNEMDLYYTEESNNFKTRVESERVRLETVLDNLAFDLRSDSSKLWTDPSLLFMYDWVIPTLPPNDLSAYKFTGIYITTPEKICYLE